MENRIISAMRLPKGCDLCFSDGLQRADSNAPQPRWFGPNYFTAKRRIAIVLINPGGGGSSITDQMKEQLQHEADLFRSFHQTGDYDPIRQHFQAQIASGSPWLCWYRDMLGIDLDDVALINIAWCATMDNKYPRSMLNCCFEEHTKKLLKALNPHIVLLSGSATHSYEQQISKLLSPVSIIQTLHYAHRKGQAFEKGESARIREELKRTVIKKS